MRSGSINTESGRSDRPISLTSGKPLYASDVQEHIRATERPVEVGLVSGVAAEDLHPRRVEAGGVGAIGAEEAANLLPFGQQEL